MNQYVFFLLGVVLAVWSLPRPVAARQHEPDQGGNVFPALIHPGCLLLIGARAAPPDGASLIVQSIPTEESGGAMGEACTNFQAGDRIVSVNGNPVATVADFREGFASVDEGGTLRFVVSRGGEEVSFSETRIAQMAAPRGQGQMFVAPGGGASNWVTAEEEAGAAPAEQPYVLRGYVLVPEQGTVTVVMKQRDADAALGLQPGDQVVSINGEVVSTTDALRRAIEQAVAGTRVRLGIRRNDTPAAVEFRK